MGEVKVEFLLENTLDRELAVRGSISEAEVRSVKVAVLTDTGSVLQMLPQEIVELVGLRELRKAIVTSADERKEECAIAGMVTVRVGNRAAESVCIVGPPNSEPLLGQTPLEIMDLLVDCAERRLVPRPESPYLPLVKLK